MIDRRWQRPQRAHANRPDESSKRRLVPTSSIGKVFRCNK